MPARTTMLADVMPNILAHAPYESVFGLTCACRALSRSPIERAKYVVDKPIRLDNVIGAMTQYPNGWRLCAHIHSNDRPSAVHNVVYKNNAPLAAYMTDNGRDTMLITSLVTGVYCIIDYYAFYIPGNPSSAAYVNVCRGHVTHNDLVDERTAQAIATVARPLLVDTSDVVTIDVIRTAVKAMNIYARHVGDCPVEVFYGASGRAMATLVG